MNFVAIEERRIGQGGTTLYRLGRARIEVEAKRLAHADRIDQVRIRHVLGQPERHIHPEPIDTEIKPEGERVQGIDPHLIVDPVQVRLGVVEQVQVPLPPRSVGFFDPSPRRTAEDRLPIVGWQFSHLPLAVHEMETAAGVRPNR